MNAIQNNINEIPVILFNRQKDWADWLNINHAISAGLWLRLAKKTASLESVSYQEALEVALCYGWIDGQKKSCDESSWLQKFTPRGVRSLWSKINREKAETLIENGQMQPSGLLAIESARKTGRWDAAYASQREATVPLEFQICLNANAQAKAFFDTLDSRNRYAILFRIQTAKKAETRARRIEQFIKMLEKHEKVYP